MAAKSLEQAISAFGQAAKSKLSNVAISGGPEDQLRGPLETLIKDIALIAGHAPDTVVPVGETSISEDRVRPDYAITVRNALVGFVEVKAPGKGANPKVFRDKHDKAQWDKLKSLPNLLYTDGNSFGLWRDGDRVGDIVHLAGDVETSGDKLGAPEGLVALFTDFLIWKPEPPKSPKRLAQMSARLCRLLREEVLEQLERKNAGLTGLAEDWRKLLFPEANDANFADGYAQAVTFGLLIARARNIPLDSGIDQAANALRKTNSLIGTALRLLTDDVDNLKSLETSLGTMLRVFHEVDWPTLSKGDPDAWLYFYEDFLEVYDNALRKRTGSYYTPPEVVNAMTRLVDEALRGPLFNRPDGLASADVTIADPAMGTGTFLLGVQRRIAQTVSDDLGPGSVPGALEAAASRLIGFEMQFGPFAVAQLRLLAEYAELMEKAGTSGELPELKLFITDTLGNPFVEDEYMPSIMQPVAQSRRAANQIKKTEKITVVIGNPPYKEKAEGKGGWIEKGSTSEGVREVLHAPLDRWRPPVEWGAGAHTNKLKNLYVYFWRWASLKVFGSGWKDATGLPDADEEGIVCFITVAGFLNGPGFQKMRADLRESCSDIWVIDCSPEGFQPAVSSRIFQGVQQEVCIVVAARRKGKNVAAPANVHFRSLSEGRRENKFVELGTIKLTDSGWSDAPSEWRGPFLPEATGQWVGFAPLGELFDYSGSGVTPHRTWVIAPDIGTLERRWETLRDAPNDETKAVLFHPDSDRTVDKAIRIDLGSFKTPPKSVLDDKEANVPPVRYAFRSFDRQWIIPDHRLLSRARPKLWPILSDRQVFMTALSASSPQNGPAVSFTGLIVDLDHYKGSFGGRVFPLWADAEASMSNVSPVILAHLAEAYGREISAPGVMAYIAGVMAHPALTARFAKDLKQPGLRVPFTSDAALFERAVALGSEVIWLHTYGERFDDAAAGRSKQAPRLPKDVAPIIPNGGAIPGAPEPLPDTIEYDPAAKVLHVGKGRIENVMPEIWAYEVSGKQVVRQWFSYRKRDRSRPIIGDRRPPSPLDSIQPDHWLNEYTTDLMNLLHVLGRLVLLEPRQAELLDQILELPMLSLADLGLASDNGDESDEETSDVPT